MPSLNEAIGGDGGFGTGAIKLVETYIGKGAIRDDIQDPKIPVFGRDVGMASPPFDWTKGYDIENELSKELGIPFKITVKDQDNSSSCGGQAWGYYGQVLLGMLNKDTRERSAKYIYAQVFQGIGGSGGKAICDLLIGQGWGLEADTTSYQQNQPPREEFMQRVQDISVTARVNAKQSQALSYALVPILQDNAVELIAQAIRDNHGAIMGLTGVNNGTWLSQKPTPPTTFSNSWNHWLFIGKVKLVNQVRWFGFLNSWGESCGDGGWQWITEDYFKLRILGYPAIWSVWTMLLADKDKPIVVPEVPLYVFKKTLRLGMKDNDVAELQIRLNRIMFNLVQLKVDGDFGQKTLQAVRNFQSLRGLIQDGVVGKLTIAELAKIFV